MGATIRQFENGIQHHILFLDSSFLLASIGPKEVAPEHRHKKCQRFLTKLGNKISDEKLLCYISDFVIDEFFYRIIKILYERELPNYPAEKAIHEAQNPDKTFDWYQLYHNHPELLEGWLLDLDKFYSTIILLGIRLVQPIDLPRYLIPPLAVSAKEMITDFHLLPADAFHIATAKALGIEGIVAIDRHFHNVDGIVVYTCLHP